MAFDMVATSILKNKIKKQTFLIDLLDLAAKTDNYLVRM